MATRFSSRLEFDERLLRNLDQAAIDAIYLTADALLTEVKDAGVMPRDTGHMQNDQTEVVKEDKSASIVTTAEQAERLYFHPEYNFNRTKNANAGAKWFEPWISGDRKDFIERTYAEMLRREGDL